MKILYFDLSEWHDSSTPEHLIVPDNITEDDIKKHYKNWVSLTKGEYGYRTTKFSKYLKKNIDGCREPKDSEFIYFMVN